MRILIHTIGTRGDVQPYVALGRGLSNAGHEVTICTCQQFESFVVEHGLAYAHVNNELLDFIHSDDGKLAMERTGTLWESIRVGFKLFPKVRPMLTRQINDAWRSTQAADPQLILFHPKSITAIDFAEKLATPCMLAFYLPLYHATSKTSAMGFPQLPLGAGYNRWTYRMIERFTWWGTGKLVNAWRRSVDMSARRRRPYLTNEGGRSIPAVYAYSESVIPRPADWPDEACISGYWFLDADEAWAPDERLREFIEDGDPPIYFGFGSIFGRDPQRVVRTVVESCERVGVRAIVARGWGGLDATGVDLPESVLAIDAAPHDWLFPRVAAVVHHGGCGTTAAGLRAGKPTIICPFFGDQPFWGEQVARLGVGPPAIPQRRLNAARLTGALREVRTNETMREKAVEIGRRIRAEDGVARAVEFIERQMSTTR